MRFSKILSTLFFLASLTVFVGYTFFYNTKGDTEPPVIHVDDTPFECSIETTEEEMLSGITASDKQDGDLTDQIFVESLSNFIEDNTRILYVAVIDKAGNAAKGKRIITYNDYSSPKFSMSSPLVFYEGGSITEGIHAEDVLDGDISGKVQPCSPYHLSYKPGDYPMEFMVSNSAGDISRFTATVSLKSFLMEDHPADIKLSKYLVYTSKGKKVKAWSYVKGLDLNGHLYRRNDADILVPDEESSYNWNDYPEMITKADFKIVNNVDYENEGCYEIEYIYDNGSYSGSVRLVVIVE